ncbi:HAD-superfamily hydrolase subfamily IA, variant 3 [gamma proteobacterium HdN1]|nr:HAD-superfamily hydrolase subfamily IA, variant 3 [gamma proteobacterium HdN1]
MMDRLALDWENKNWENIDTVLLDMDGTLLDLSFDNYFWLQYLPEQFASARHTSIEDAKAQLTTRFGQHHGTLNWYCVDFWSNALDLDIRALKHSVRERIQPRPHAIDFLRAVKNSGRTSVLCTNAHRASLDLKLAQTDIGQYFDLQISSHDFGYPKEDPHFWNALREYLGSPSQHVHYDTQRTLLIDDNATVLQTAHNAGIGFLLGVLKPDLQREEMHYAQFAAVDDFRHIFPPERG